MLKNKVVDTRGRLLVALGYGLWPSMVLISEIVQTFILADFCYYYVKRYAHRTTFIKVILRLYLYKPERVYLNHVAVYSEGSLFSGFRLE